MTIKRGVYVGPLPHLKGESALLDFDKEPGRVLAQFDNTDTGLGYGWTDFGVEAFAQVQAVSWSHDEQPELPLEMSK